MVQVVNIALGPHVLVDSMPNENSVFCCIFIDQCSGI